MFWYIIFLFLCCFNKLIDLKVGLWVSQSGPPGLAPYLLVCIVLPFFCHQMIVLQAADRPSSTLQSMVGSCCVAHSIIHPPAAVVWCHTGHARLCSVWTTTTWEPMTVAVAKMPAPHQLSSSLIPPLAAPDARDKGDYFFPTFGVKNLIEMYRSC